jgi:peroxin-5
MPPVIENSAKWEAIFNQSMTSHREDDLDYDFDAAMQEAFQSGEHIDFQNQSSYPRFEEGLPILSPYSFGVL